jgi:hypothetical protein
MILAVDPGVRGSGVAVFDCGKLVNAAYVPNLVEKGNRACEAASMAASVHSWVCKKYGSEWSKVETLALEWPQIYATRIRMGLTKEDPNDLLALCGVQASLATLFVTAQVFSYLPSEWKGQMKKEACHRRINQRLLEEGDQEPLYLASEEIGNLAHNIWDAVGIGLFHLNRFDKKRVIPT